MLRSSSWLLVLIGPLGATGCGDTSPALDAGMDVGEAFDTAAVGCATGGCDDPDASHCDPATDRCVACLDASHCDNAAPICVAGSCRPCLTGTQCMDQLGQAECRSDGQCVECISASDCPELSPFCAADGRCVECVDESDCSDLAPSCASGSCRSCADVDCTPGQEVREFFAYQCRVAIADEGESELADALEALLCSTRPQLFPFFAYIERAAEAGRIEIDQDLFAECRDASAVPLLDDGACSRVIRGTVVDGGVCAVPYECVSGRCDVPPASCAGTCVGRVDAGVACDDDDACLDGLICLSAICQAPPGEGATCTSRCDSDFFCNAARICEARHAVGGTCRGVASGGDCLDGLACRSGRCAAPPTDGAACWPEYLERCAEGVRCDGTTCRVPRSNADACDATVQCAFASRCHDGRCEAILSLGDECIAGDPCALGTGCVDGRCRPLPDLGEPCFESGCLRGSCRDGTCQPAALFTACAPGQYIFDVLDPCGGSSSCAETPSGWQCVPEGGPGAACDGPTDLPCRQPDLYCNTSRACAAYCSP